MNNSVKGLIAGGSVLVILGGVLAALKLTEKPKEESSAEPTESMVALWSYASDDVSKITVSNPDGDSYVANRRMEKVKDTDANGNETEVEVANYYLEGYEDLPMSTISIRLLATRAESVNSNQTIQENTPESDLAQYGLDKPISVRLDVDNAEPISFLIGDISPDNTVSYLSMANDPKTVYTVSTNLLAPYRDNIKTYLGLEVTPAQAEDDDTTVKSVRVERKDLDYDFYFVEDGSDYVDLGNGSMASHVMEEPIHCLLNVSESSKATHGLYALTASEVIQPKPTDADKEKYGLNDPLAKVTSVTSDGKTKVFLVGNKYKTEDTVPETRYYGYLEGVDCIYGFSTENMIYATMKPQDLTSKNVIETYVWDIGKLNYAAGSTKLDFTIKGASQDEAEVKVNGEACDDERYRQLYAFLLATAAEDLVLEEVHPTDAPLAEVHAERQDGKRTYDIKYYDAGGMKAYIEVDGVICYKCRKSYVDALVSNINIFFDKDKEFTVTW